MSSCASRPIEAMVWTNEIESAKSIANVKTSYSVTGGQVADRLRSSDTKIASGLTKIINGDFKRKSSFKEKLHKRKNAFSWEGKSHG